MKLAILLFGALLLAQGQPAPPKDTPSKPAAAPAPAKSDLSSPEAAVRSFMAAYSRLDLVQAATCVVDARPVPMLMTLQADMQKSPDRPTFTLGNVRAEISGETARVTATITAAAQPPGQAAPQSVQLQDQVQLRRAGPEWKIVAPDLQATIEASQGPEHHLLPVFVTMVAHPEVFMRAREAARQASCIANVRLLCNTALLFSSDHNERFALQAATYQARLRPYLKSDRAFHCPVELGDNVSYSFNIALQGVAEAQIQQPARTVLIYEGKDQTLNFRHDGRAIVGFVDGHAAAVTAQEARLLRWKP